MENGKPAIKHSIKSWMSILSAVIIVICACAIYLMRSDMFSPWMLITAGIAGWLIIILADYGVNRAVQWLTAGRTAMKNFERLLWTLVKGYGKGIAVGLVLGIFIAITVAIATSNLIF